MESNSILQADILDIIFEGKNKEYGAYDLRRTYNRRLLKSIGVTAAVIGLVFVGGMVSGRGTKKGVAMAPPPDLVIASVDNTPPPTPPPVLPKPQPQQVRSIAFVTPKVTPDDQVKPDEHPPVVDDLNDAKISNQTHDGTLDDGTALAPPAPAGNGGVIETPKKKEDEPEIWTKVEIESQFPDGPAAWLRFLHKNINYPDDAINNGIGGQIMVQFIVDEEGNVSNVQAVSGPEAGGLREEAVRVIRKSGKWTAAIQNGRKVKSYKRQPITFMAPE
jgi:protein TonB